MTSQQPERPPGHVFVSYVREDWARVDRLERELKSAGIRVWRDINDIDPGGDWQLAIKKAINDGSIAFLACFSNSSESRSITYQREELILAAEQMRLRAPDQVWLIPVRFDDCAIPDYSIGPDRTFNSLNRVDLFDGPWPQLNRLIMRLKKFLSTDDTTASDGTQFLSALESARLPIGRSKPARSFAKTWFTMGKFAASGLIAILLAALWLTGSFDSPRARIVGPATLPLLSTSSPSAAASAEGNAKPVGMTGGCPKFRVYAQNRFNPPGSAIRSAPTPQAPLLLPIAPNYQFYVDGFVHGDVAYPYNPPPLNSDVWFHVSDGGWVSLAGVRSVPTSLDPTGHGDDGPLVPTLPECLGVLQ